MDDEVRLLFRELVDLAPAERERLWAERKISLELRVEVESLLAFDSRKGDRSFTECVAGAAGEALRAGGDTRAARCGPYRLVRLLGQDGMGAVYLGERADGELQQNVAVKFLAAGEPRPEWRDRFLTERLILAYLAERWEPAKALSREAGDLLDRFNTGRNDQAVGPDVLATYARVANEHYRHQEIESAIRLYDRALGIARLLKSEAQAGNLLWVKAQVLQARGDLDQALAAIQESIRASDPGPGRTAPTAQMVSFVLALNFEGKLLGLDNDISMGLLREGAEILDRSFGIIDEFVHRDPGDQISRSRLADAGVNLGNVLLHFDARRALEIYDHTLANLGEIKETSHFGDLKRRDWQAPATRCETWAVPPTPGSVWMPRSRGYGNSSCIRRTELFRVRRPRILFVPEPSTKGETVIFNARPSSTRRSSI